VLQSAQRSHKVPAVVQVVVQVVPVVREVQAPVARVPEREQVLAAAALPEEAEALATAPAAAVAEALIRNAAGKAPPALQACATRPLRRRAAPHRAARA
jgi:hypothetical protein